MGDPDAIDKPQMSRNERACQFISTECRISQSCRQTGSGYNMIGEIRLG